MGLCDFIPESLLNIWTCAECGQARLMSYPWHWLCLNDECVNRKIGKSCTQISGCFRTKISSAHSYHENQNDARHLSNKVRLTKSTLWSSIHIGLHYLKVVVVVAKNRMNAQRMDIISCPFPMSFENASSSCCSARLLASETSTDVWSMMFTMLRIFCICLEGAIFASHERKLAENF